jgi:hypothetical protein
MGDMKLSKSILIGGIAATLIVIGSGIGGGLYALNMERSSDKIQNNKAETLNSINSENNLNGWENKGGSWSFYKDNEKQNGWIQDKNLWYYLGSDGKMRTGWIKDKDNWYYLNSDGSMATNKTVDGCYLNANGLIEDPPSNYTTKNNSSQNTQNDSTQDSLYKSNDPNIQKILGKWTTFFSDCMAFLRRYNCDYIDITTKTFQGHPYKVIGEYDGYIDIRMLDSSIEYRISFDLNTDLHIVADKLQYPKDELNKNTVAGYIVWHRTATTFKRYHG